MPDSSFPGRFAVVGQRGGGQAHRQDDRRRPVYRDDPLLLPEGIRDRFRDETPARVTADYLAGMTDRFAMTEHRKLLDPHAPA